ncbi:MAG: type VI secretion system protein TssA [Burkholderiales bacterium]|nr:MAG: type VI secretion system protein TssA [Burkholderiales bacterium]
MYDLSHLAEPIDGDQPCGPDCEYDGRFLALSQAAAGKPEQQFGDTIIAAVEPDWRAVESKATELLGHTKDLRIVAWLTEAATHLHGVAGFAAGVQLMNLLCERYWEDVHPRLIIEGEPDPFLRIGALAALSSSGGGYADGSPVMRALRDAHLVERTLQVKIRDFEQTAANDAAARYSEAQISAALQEAVAQGAEAIAAFEQAAASVVSLSSEVGQRMSGDEQPDFSALKTLMNTVSTAIARARPTGTDGLADGNVASEASGVSDPATGGRGFSGEVRSMQEARLALQRVCTYLERHEPSSPASLFARRAERMLGMDFMNIMRELSPDSIQHIQMLTGVKSPDE